MADSIQQPIVNGITYVGASAAVFGSWMNIIQPTVAVLSGIAALILACLQIYSWIKKNRDAKL